MNVLKNTKSCLQFLLITLVAIGFAALPFVGSFVSSAYAAEENDVSIVEVMPNPAGSDTDGEYILLENSSASSSVSLEGWSLDSNLSHTFSPGTGISNTLKVCRGTNASTTASGCDVFDADIEMVNGGGTITLTDDQGGKIDEETYSDRSGDEGENQPEKFSVESLERNTTSDECKNPDPNNDLKVNSFDASAGTVSIENTSDNCSYDVGIAAYKGFATTSSDKLKIKDPNGQKLHSATTSAIAGGGDVSFDVDVPNCAYQIDTFYGDLINDFNTEGLYNDRKLGDAFEHVNTDNLCKDEDDTGSIEITKYSCDADVSVNRTDNKPGANTKDVDGCELAEEGVTFGYRFGDSGPFSTKTDTNSDGIATFTGLNLDDNPYKLAELDDGNSQKPNDSVHGFYCTTDPNVGEDIYSGSDNLEYADVTAGDTVECVVYNKTGADEPQEPSQCITPQTKSDNTAETVTVGNNDYEKLWEVFEAEEQEGDNDFAQIDSESEVNSEQTQTQFFKALNNSTDVKVTYIRHDEEPDRHQRADNGNVIGWYEQGATSTFTPLFQHNDHSGFSVTQGTDDDTKNFTASENFGFAVKSETPDNSQRYSIYSENNLNPNGEDRFVAYKLGTNKYAIGFEDLYDVDNSDTDFEDMTMLVEITGCEDEQEPQDATLRVCKTITDDGEIAQGDQGAEFQLHVEGVNSGNDFSATSSFSTELDYTGANGADLIDGVGIGGSGNDAVCREYSVEPGDYDYDKETASPNLDGYEVPLYNDLNLSGLNNFAEYGANNSFADGRVANLKAGNTRTIVVKNRVGGDTGGERPACDAPAESFADQVANFDQGQRFDGNDVLDKRSSSTKALGPESASDDQIDFVSLGVRGSITLEFDEIIPDINGDDIRVFETSYNDPSFNDYPESAKVLVSSDGSTFTLVGEVQLDGTIDISGSGVSDVRFVKIVDTTNPNANEFDNDNPKTLDGFDVAGIQAIGCAGDDNGDDPDPEPDTGTISGVKYSDDNGDGNRDEDEEGIGDFRILAFENDPIADFEVQADDSDGVTPTTTFATSSTYIVEVSGTYRFSEDDGPGSYTDFADAEYYTESDDFANDRQASTSDPSRDPAVLDLVTSQNSNPDWGPFRSNHTYRQITSGSNMPVNFRILEDDSNNNGTTTEEYDDNAGSLNVRIYEVTNVDVKTNPDGTYQFSNVPEGNYSVLEVNQPDAYRQTEPADGACNVEVDAGETSECDFGNEPLGNDDQEGGDDGDGSDDNDDDGGGSDGGSSGGGGGGGVLDPGGDDGSVLGDEDNVDNGNDDEGDNESTPTGERDLQEMLDEARKKAQNLLKTLEERERVAGAQTSPGIPAGGDGSLQEPKRLAQAGDTAGESGATSTDDAVGTTSTTTDDEAADTMTTGTEDGVATAPSATSDDNFSWGFWIALIGFLIVAGLLWRDYGSGDSNKTASTTSGTDDPTASASIGTDSASSNNTS